MKCDEANSAGYFSMCNRIYTLKIVCEKVNDRLDFHNLLKMKLKPNIQRFIINVIYLYVFVFGYFMSHELSGILIFEQFSTLVPPKSILTLSYNHIDNSNSVSSVKFRSIQICGLPYRRNTLWNTGFLESQNAIQQRLFRLTTQMDSQNIRVINW